jgi:predicted PP-loop superfamily ATPase
LQFTKDQLITIIEEIRAEIGHEESELNIKEVIFDSKNKNLLIITPDRPDKSAVIGKGGWVVGKLREKLGVENIHVDAYTDIMVKQYRMELAGEKIHEIISKTPFNDSNALNNLMDMLFEKIEILSLFNFSDYLNITESDHHLENEKNKGHEAVVALSGGVDSSFSLIISTFLGFNPLAVTADPGSIVLPQHFKNNINNLCEDLGVDHDYVPLDFSDFINESFEGRFHPCGRCSKMIHQAVIKQAKENDINIVIFGDMLSTGSQALVYKDDILRINLPAFLGVSKQELQTLTSLFNVKKSNYFGCPLLGEVQKKFPHMRRYSIQRVLRETRAGVLEPGQALDLIWSLCKDLK